MGQHFRSNAFRQSHPEIPVRGATASTEGRRGRYPVNIKVSLVEPGMVGTRIFRSNTEAADREVQQERQRRGEMLKPEDIAVAVHYCLTQPDRCAISLVRIEPSLTD